MRLAVLRPAYFADTLSLMLAAAADVVVWADTFVFSKHSTMNRARIKTAAGPRLLTVPVLSKGGRAAVARTLIDRHNFRPRTHLRMLEVSYRNAPYFAFFSDELNDVAAADYTLLNSLCYASFEFLYRNIGLKAAVKRAVDLPQAADRTERVCLWLSECGCREYLLTAADADLIRRNEIEDKGFRVTVVDYRPPIYHQLYGDFVENLSGLDLLFNEGERSREILQNTLCSAMASKQ